MIFSKSSGFFGTKSKSSKRSNTHVLNGSVSTLSSQFNLRLANEIALTNDQASYELSATGGDPYLIIDPEVPRIIQAGWHCVYLHINNTGAMHTAKLYADLGQGYSEDEVYRLMYKPGQPMMQIVHFPSPVKVLRFDPQECPGELELVSFQLSPLSEQNATQIMLGVLAKSSRFMSLDDATLNDQLVVKANKLDATFSSVVYQTYLKEVSPVPLYGMSGASYQEWIDWVEVKQLHGADLIANNLSKWTLKPRISILLPTYNTDEKYLRACIESVINQSYPNWELCISDDCSTHAHIRTVLDEYAQVDKRIKIVYRSKNGHISKASNSALDIAGGEYIALLDHDDTLAKDALYHVVEALNKTPGACLLYTDEDWTDSQGNRIRPHFKSDWNRDLLYSHNYITHLCIYRQDIVRSVGGFREGVEGSQDYDLLLRCIGVCEDDNVIHIPRVLYHWRAIEGSTALSAGEKSYSVDAGLVSLRKHFEEYYPNLAEVSCSDLPNIYKVQWKIPTPQPLVSLLMPTRDQKEVTETAVRSILNLTSYSNFELLIIDNGSEKKETLEFFEIIQKEDKRVKVLRYDEPFNYPAINNFGFEHSSGEVIGLINNDVEVITPDWLTEMVSNALRPDIGCVGAKLYYENDTIQHAGVILGIGGVAGHSHRSCPRHESGYVARLLVRQNLSAVTAACLLVRRSIYQEVEGLDQENLEVAFNDVDFCLKVRAKGYRNLWTPFAELYHYESISRGYENTPEKIKRFERETDFMKNKWSVELRKDPYYNPNLTMIREDFSLDAEV